MTKNTARLYSSKIDRFRSTKKGGYIHEFHEGNHPDKVCDQIADSILDALLAQDPLSRCACEVTAEPGAIIKRLRLRNPIYTRTAAYGHFGKKDFPWEQLDDSLLDSLKELRS